LEVGASEDMYLDFAAASIVEYDLVQIRVAVTVIFADCYRFLGGGDSIS
jgi:hypothetical protein